MQGYVEKLLVRATYDSVRAGQPLAELYVPEWLAAQEELLALKGSAQPGAAALVDAARARLGLLGMPAAEIARVEREGRPSARVTITAPQSGVVWEIGARDGMAVMQGTTLFRLAGQGSVWVVAEVPEAQAGALRTGAPVEATIAAFPGRVFKGTVSTLLPEVNAATRTVRARIVLANPDVSLKPGMFATVQFAAAASSAKPVLLVPAEAVIRTGKRNVVIVALGEGRYAPVEVELGRESGDSVEIRKGLEPGASVVASGQFMIDSEASLKGVLARMGAGAEANADPHAGHAMPAAPGAVIHEAQGVVRGVGDEVLIKHGAIPGAGMGAMTMAFKAPHSGVPAAVKEDGQRALPLRHHAQGRLRAHRHRAHRRTRRGGRGTGSEAMIAAVIRWSVGNRFLVVLASVALAVFGLWAARTTPLDAIPDLSNVGDRLADSPGPALAIVEDQVTSIRCRVHAGGAGVEGGARLSIFGVLSSTSSSRTAPIRTGHARACSST